MSMDTKESTVILVVGENRTHLDGFAIRCLTIRPSPHNNLFSVDSLASLDN